MRNLIRNLLSITYFLMLILVPVAARSQLRDVSISSPATSQILQYNGKKWVNEPAAFSVEAFGAKGDGITDDTAELRLRTLDWNGAAGTGAAAVDPGQVYVMAFAVK